MIVKGKASFIGKGGKPKVCRNDRRGVFVRLFRLFFLWFMICWAGFSSAGSIESDDISVGRISDAEIFLKRFGYQYRCSIDKKPTDIKLSSDGESVILSGTSYILVDELMKCNPAVVVRANIAAPHIGFLSDVNIRMGIYASLVPVSLNPMSFLVVVAKIGSDKNIVNLPGFYLDGVRVSKMLTEASQNLSPVISLDGRYVSPGLHGCGSNKYVDVVDIKLSKWTQIDLASCEKLFNFR